MRAYLPFCASEAEKKAFYRLWGANNTDIFPVLSSSLFSISEVLFVALRLLFVVFEYALGHLSSSL